MADIKNVIAKNISELRISCGMTQLDLANELHYSDKAVSKWERGESVPEITTLIAISKLFGVTVDYLLCEEHGNVAAKETEKRISENKKANTGNRAVISAMSVLIVWFAALLVYVMIDVISPLASAHWLAFVFAVPTSAILWLIFNSLWFDVRKNYLIISLLVWSLIASLYLSMLSLGYNLWQFYLLGIPGQIAVILWSKLKFQK